MENYGNNMSMMSNGDGEIVVRKSETSRMIIYDYDRKNDFKNI